MSTPQVWDLYAIKYAEMAERTRRDNLLNHDPHDTSPMPMDYFVWAAVAQADGRTVVIDTGFDKPEGDRRGRTVIRSVSEALAMGGIDAARVEDVVVTHMHYDHIGGHAEFPAAKFHMQESEMHFCTGKHMCSPFLNRSFTADHIAAMVRNVFAGRVAYYDGSAEIAPGIVVHHVGGHAMGLQVVHVLTQRGWVVVASDATHYYANMETGVPFTTAFHLGDMILAFDRLRQLAGGDESRIVPGHDPLVLARYPAPDSRLQGVVARLDVAPK